MQRAAILPSAASLAPPYFSTLSPRRRDFREKVTEHEMCVLVFCTTLFETFLILGTIKRDIVINVKTSSCEVPTILVGFELNLNFLDRHSKKKKAQISSLIKICPVGDELFHAERQTDVKLTVAFRNFANTPKKHDFD